MRPEPGQVLHFSEDPSITRFVPHLAATARQPGEYVRAVDARRCPDYWFPRQCPRVMAWTGPGSSAADRDRIVGPGCGERVHAVEYGWLERMRTVELYAYRFDAAPFRPFEADGGGGGSAVVATEPVVPLGPAERVGDLFALHEEAGIALRVLPRLWPFCDEVTRSSLQWSGIRLRNALPSQGG
ncbi:hypothetical protein SAMN05216188_10585 [Lentzea xinjiangensis]|uniref:Uncharacterized protein n=1 Tax=Lentzea xinjiangensis TaxID=402600 RepID=A0A1H9IUU7_9PSEU|nr:DUF6886 family protein [Lentzea xinjiangensis]SEQ78288.1 hypothetical protein SAMN05216188_10585 [Lentzea xinjiangensis]